jgi:hypothetical protein
MLAMQLCCQVNNIKGFCIDNKGKPIENVFIKANTIPIQNTYSDENGMYIFSFNTGDTVELVYQANEIIKKESVFIEK